MNLNKACETSDLSDPELVTVIRDVFQDGSNGRALGPANLTRQDWELAMPMVALRRLGALHRDAVVLVISAGTNHGVFYLTRHVRQVFATDKYLPAPTETRAWPAMLVEPSLVAPGEFEESRLVTQHMDPRALRFPDETFDAVVSWGSKALVGLGSHGDVANAVYEMGRVLKPGGVLAVSTQLLLGGPPGGTARSGLRPFSAEELRRYVIEASGLEPVDELNLAVSGDALAAARYAHWPDADIRESITKNRYGPTTGGADDGETAVAVPREGYVIGSVHVTMRRGPSYPHPPNDWARPTQETLSAVTRANARLLTADKETAAAPDVMIEGPEPLQPVQPQLTGSWAESRAAAATRAASVAADRDLAVAQLTSLRALKAESSRHLEQLSREQEDASTKLRTLSRLRNAAAGRPSHPRMRDEQRLATGDAGLDRSSWKVFRTSLSTGREIKVVVDSNSDDPVSAAFRAGGGSLYESQLVGLMLELVKPGDVVLDLGAHVGTFALSAAAGGCEVVAIEASVSNAALLRASAAANRFRSLRVVTVAAGDHGGSVEFFAHGPWGHVVEADSEGPRVSVPCVRIDDLLAELGIPRVAFVKMDIEGSEIAAIRGMRRLLEPDDAPPLLYESNGHTLAFLGATPEDLLRELSGLGYTSYIAEPPRLIRVTADEWQPQTLVNYLAFKHPPETLSGWRLELGLTSEERVQRVVTECQQPNPDQRAYIAGALRRSPDSLRGHRAIAKALAGLRHDPVSAVRHAAQWSAVSGTGEPQ